MEGRCGNTRLSFPGENTGKGFRTCRALSRKTAKISETRRGRDYVATERLLENEATSTTHFTCQKSDVDADGLLRGKLLLREGTVPLELDKEGYKQEKSLASFHAATLSVLLRPFLGFFQLLMP